MPFAKAIVTGSAPEWNKASNSAGEPLIVCLAKTHRRADWDTRMSRITRCLGDLLFISLLRVGRVKDMRIRRYFSVKHLGFECARREAILLRQQWKGDVNEQVLKALEEEKAAMEAAAIDTTAGGAFIRTRGSGEINSPSLRPTAVPSALPSSPSRLPHAGTGGEGAPMRREKTGTFLTSVAS